MPRGNEIYDGAGLVATQVEDTLKRLRREGSAGVYENVLKDYSDKLTEAKAADTLTLQLRRKLAIPLRTDFGNQWKDVYNEWLLAQEKKATTPAG